MPAKIKFLHSPLSVTSGHSFLIRVTVEDGIEHETIALELQRFDIVEGPWHATAVINSTKSGLARFEGVSLKALGSAKLRCSSTSHFVIAAGTSVHVRAPAPGATPSIASLVGDGDLPGAEE